MPITTTYPGVYIEELPSMSHSVTAAPTSVTAFIGYTHPFKTLAWNTAVELFSFADYQANFGGFFDFDPWLPDYVGNAVFQFFENGGSDAWVVGLQATDYVDSTGQPASATLSPATLQVDMSPGASPNTAMVTFSALQPGGTVAGTTAGMATVVTFANRGHSTPAVTDYDVADVIVTYGTTVETYRQVPADQITQQLAQSALVTVQVQAGGTPGNYPALQPGQNSLGYSQAPPTGATLIDPGAYGAAFTSGASLDVDVPIFNLMVLPGISPISDQQSAVLSQALAFCEQKRAFFIMDAPPNASTSAAGAQPPGVANPTPMSMSSLVPLSANGAIYFPYLQTVDPITQQPMTSPPSGFVAGIFAREDASWSVGKAPAGLETTLLGMQGVVPWGRMTDMQQGVLNPAGVNCLRDFPNIGTVVFGARTLVSANPAYEQWKYIPVRRTALFLEQSLYGSLGWAVFQPNDVPLWNALTQEVEAFMLSLFRQGSYFQGSTPSEAFLVQCDATTTTPADQAQGVVNILVGFAPLNPAEFVVIQITQLAGQTQT
jgi:uncharacterized protein